MNELVHLQVSQLENIKRCGEAYGAKLRDKRHLKKLSLSWKWNDTLSQDESLSQDDTLSQDECDDDIIPEFLTTAGHGSSSSKPSLDMVDLDEVLEGLEPNLDLKHLYISGYNGTSPSWLASNITSLQTLHLEDCGKWKILPSLERLPFLTKLKLRNMRKVIEVLVPPLEELVLVKMPKLKTCSCTSLRGFNSSLWALQIKKCHSLKEFDLFENYDKLEIDQNSWLPGLHKLIMSECPLNNLLAPTILRELFANNVSTLPLVKGPSSEKLTIRFDDEEDDDEGDADQLGILYLNDCLQITELSIEEEEDSRANLTSAREAALSGHPDVKLTGSAEFNFISSLKNIIIADCPNLTFNVGKKGLSRFTSLEKLEIGKCPKLLWPLVHKDINDDGANGRWLLPQSLRELKIHKDCYPETLQPCFIGNQTCLAKLEVSCMPCLKSLQLQFCTALEELTIAECRPLEALEGLQSLGSLRCLEIDNCPSLRPYSERLSMQGPELCPLLPRLETLYIPGTSLLTTSLCKHLSSLQGLKLSNCNSETTRLTGSALQLMKSLQELQFGYFKKLEDLPAELSRLLSLKKLCIYGCNGDLNLTGMVLPASLRELKLWNCGKLIDLPAELHILPSLKKFQIWYCYGISRLPEMGLPHSLEELDIGNCSQELTDECRKLATRKLKVRINWKWIN